MISLCLSFACLPVAGQITPDVGFSVEQWTAPDGLVIDAVRNEAFGAGVIGARVEGGQVVVYRMSDPASFEEIGRVDASVGGRVSSVRFDRTGAFDHNLFVTVVSTIGSVVHLLDETLAPVGTDEFVGSFVQAEVVGGGGFPPGAYYFADTFGPAPLAFSPPGFEPVSLFDDINDGAGLRTTGVEWDDNGEFDGDVVLVECDTGLDRSAVYRLAPGVGQLEQVVPPTATSGSGAARFWDVAFSSRGALGVRAYVLEGVAGEIQYVLRNGVRVTFATGLNIFDGGQLSIDDSGERMWAATADGLVFISPASCGAADLAPPSGIIDLTDADAFIGAFIAGDELADLAAPVGVIDLDDVDAFIVGFLAGCD